MRFDKFTIKSQELVQQAQALATRHNNQQIEPEHIVCAMLEEGEGIANAILRKLGVSPDSVRQAMLMAVNNLPKIAGSGDIYYSPTTKHILNAAFTEAARMKDEYVSIEHILLAVLDEGDSQAGVIFNQQGVTRNRILKVLMEIRGSQRITDPNP
ncbi:MAG: type VI secretion system ATPase TssH, partial [Deltaproteobacteria bacterium]|nr:type VI secretion system ATPase TssH [Deltaproteobacteria bacterium]